MQIRPSDIVSASINGVASRSCGSLHNLATVPKIKVSMSLHFVANDVVLK